MAGKQEYIWVIVETYYPDGNVVMACSTEAQAKLWESILDAKFCQNMIFKYLAWLEKSPGDELMTEMLKEWLEESWSCHSVQKVRLDVPSFQIQSSSL